MNVSLHRRPLAAPVRLNRRLLAMVREYLYPLGERPAAYCVGNRVQVHKCTNGEIDTIASAAELVARDIKQEARDDLSDNVRRQLYKNAQDVVDFARELRSRKTA